MTYPAKLVPVKSASTFIFKAMDETQAERPGFYYAVQLLGGCHTGLEEQNQIWHLMDSSGSH